VDAVVIRSLTREYRISTGSPELAGLLAFIDARPEMVDLPLTAVEISADLVPGGFRLSVPGREVFARTYIEAANRLHAMTFTSVQEEAPGAPLVHGASLVHDGQRLIVIGPKGAGKSTLTLHLLAHGFEVEGDEHVALRESDLVARPRRMRVKPGSLPLVPSLAEAVRRSPRVDDPLSGGPVYAVDPAISGRTWRIRPGHADHLVFLEANHGGGSALSAIGQDHAFPRLAEHCLLPADGRAAATARLHRLASEAQAWRLALGDLDEARFLLVDCVAKKPRHFVNRDA
jgi:hypothetical protein